MYIYKYMNNKEDRKHSKIKIIAILRTINK